MSLSQSVYEVWGDELSQPPTYAEIIALLKKVSRDGFKKSYVAAAAAHERPLGPVGVVIVKNAAKVVDILSEWRNEIRQAEPSPRDTSGVSELSDSEVEFLDSLSTKVPDWRQFIEPDDSLSIFVDYGL
jgi:hypothetical protein